METVLKAIADWIKGILTAGIMSNLSGLFDDVNTQVGNIAQQVGTKPSSFEPRVFAMIEALSRNVVLPIAGIILTFIACYELMGGDSYCNALLVIKGCYPQQRWSDCVCTGGKPRLRLLAEQTRQQRNEGDAHQSDTAASHELLHTLTLAAGVIVAITFQQVDGTPNAKTGTQSDNQSLKNFDSRVKEFHSRFSFINESCRPSVHT